MSLIIVNEIWRTIDGFLNYQISNIGNVRNANNGKILKPRSRKGYLYVGLYADDKQINHSIHRLVAKAFIPNTTSKPQVDHIDNNKVNNSVNNLRWASSEDNQRNKPKTLKPKTSKYIGVCWNKKHKKWYAHIKINKKTIYLGCFDDPKDAARAYNERLIILATEYCVLNEISDNEELI